MAESAEYWKRLYQKLEEDFNAIQKQMTSVTISYSKLLEKNKKQKQKQKLKLIRLLEQNKALKASQKVYEENNEVLLSTMCKTSSTTQQSLFGPSFTKNFPGTCSALITRMFEAFFVLGEDSENTKEVKVIEQYPGNYESSHNGIWNFAFPQGFRPLYIDLSRNVTALSQLLYPAHGRNENSFVFTVKSNESGTLGRPSITNNEKEVLYGCCVIKYELATNETGQMKGLAHPKCYCLLSYIPCFELHFQVLYTLLSIERTQFLYEEGSSEVQTASSFKSIESLKEESLLLEEQKGLLEAYYSEDFLSSRTTYINFQTVNPLKVNVPKDLSFLDTEWFCSLMFSVLDLNEFFQILCAAMNERNIVFVSSNLSLISSCVLGVQALMKPFKWAQLIVPVLPLSLYEVLEAPVPFIIGIPELPAQEVYSSSTLMYLDRPRSCKRLIGAPVAEPYANDLKEHIRTCYNKFWQKACYSPSSDQLKDVRRISKEIREFWDEVIEKIPKKKLGNNVRNEDIEDSRESVLTASTQADSAFLRGMVNTQYFSMMIGDCLKL